MCFTVNVSSTGGDDPGLARLVVLWFGDEIDNGGVAAITFFIVVWCTTE